MTGLDAKRDALVEVAVIITDSDLVPLGDGIDLVIAAPPDVVDAMNDVVREMHTASGLINEIAGGISMAEARERVMAYVKRYVPEGRKAPLAGNSIGTDKVFLEREMPELIEHLHYRVIDVSSIKELARRWYPRAYYASPRKNGAHRALADIADSIDELRYYRHILFPGDPGPTSDDARRVAALIQASPTRSGH